ncbi:MAG TPA: hypothetical protein VGI47_08660 [Candidatus Binataceae bacterium]
MRRALRYTLAMFAMLGAAACTPDQAMDFGTAKEVTAPPSDSLSAQILKDFDRRDFILGDNDRAADVRLSDWPKGKRVLIPFWLGVNPLYPGFLRPIVGRIYVIGQSTLVRPLNHGEYLIRAGSKMFKADTLFESTHTHYTSIGTMLPTVVRFVGTRVITVPQDAPQTGTVTEKVPVLREVSLPMHTDGKPDGYAEFEVGGRDA